MAVQGSAVSLALSGGADNNATTKGLTGNFSVLRRVETRSSQYLACCVVSLVATEKPC